MSMELFQACLGSLLDFFMLQYITIYTDRTFVLIVLNYRMVVPSGHAFNCKQRITFQSAQVPSDGACQQPHLTPYIPLEALPNQAPSAIQGLARDEVRMRLCLIGSAQFSDVGLECLSLVLHGDMCGQRQKSCVRLAGRLPSFSSRQVSLRPRVGSLSPKKRCKTTFGDMVHHPQC